MAFPDTAPTDTAQQQAAEVQPGQLRGRTAVTCKHNWIPVEFGDPKPKHYLYFGDPKPKHYVYVCKRCHKTIAAQLKEKQ
jgi:hypothetical protein